MSNPPRGEDTPARQPLLIGVNAALALWGLLAFISGFLTWYGSSGEFGISVKGFSYSPASLVAAVALGTFGIVGAVSRTGPRQLYLLAAAAASFAVEVGGLVTGTSSFQGQSRGAGYWLLFVAVVLQVLTTAVGALVQTGVVSVVLRSTPPAGPPGYGPAPYPPPPYGGQPYSGPTYGNPGAYGAPGPGGGPSPYAPPPGGGYDGPPPTSGPWRSPER